MGKLNKLDDSSKTEIVELYKNGSSLKVIATKFGCTSPTVATFLKGEGVVVRGKGKRKKADVMANTLVVSPNPTAFAGGCVEPMEDNSGLNCVEDTDLKAVPFDINEGNDEPFPTFEDVHFKE